MLSAQAIEALWRRRSEEFSNEFNQHVNVLLEENRARRAPPAYQGKELQLTPHRSAFQSPFSRSFGFVEHLNQGRSK